MAHQISEDEDEARAALENFLYLARSIVERGDSQDAERRYLLYLSTQSLEYIPKVMAAVEQGDVWAAVRHALWVGIVEGQTQAYPDTSRTRQLQRKIERQRAGAVRGGKGKRGHRKVPDETIRMHFLRIRAEHPTWSADRIRDRVRLRLGVSKDWVRRTLVRLGELKERKRARE